MKSLRKSLNANKDAHRSHISTPMPLPDVSKPSAAITPPQKVIRALETYRSTAPQELSFQKGDFFYVVKDSQNGKYYDAHNPMNGARGLVPRNLFEEFGKNSNASRASQAISSMGMTFPTFPSQSPQAPKNKTQVFYAIVLHDFEAERADELDARRGDAITVVAQSNREWFVAKPIGKLGRPGLIPVSFVEIHDPSTGNAIPDVEALMDRGDLPKVEDWKKAVFNYKQNSIALGVIDAPANRDSVPSSPFMQLSTPPLPPSSQALPSTLPQSSQEPSRPPTPELLPNGILLSADVVSFHYEMDEYWFRIHALFQPYAPPGDRDLPSSKQLVLFRAYNDFYDFQVSLLDAFPQEAGRQPPHPRILPFMPGPAQNVDDALTAARRSELDQYVQTLCDLNNNGASYVLEHNVVREFFFPKAGDVDTAAEPRVQELEALFSEGYPGQDDDPVAPLPSSLGRLRVQDEYDKSDGSEYEDEGYAPSPQQPTYDQSRHPYAMASEHRKSPDNNLRLHAHAQNHQRNGSSSSVNRSHTPYSNYDSRSNSPVPERNQPSPQPIHEHPSSQSRWNSTSTTRSHNHSSPSVSSVLSSHAPSMNGRSRSQSNAAPNNFNSPPISSTNPQPAFVKIKIYDRQAEDLIAIRVHPKVSHAELLGKVAARLGASVDNLTYRDSLNNTLIELSNDTRLRTWMESTDKHVLYAN